MIYFDCDYHRGAHEKVLQALLQANMQAHATYGYDSHTLRANECIQNLTQSDAAAYFIAGGTLTNLTFIRSCLRVYEGVIATEEGHISTHETGAIEATGHKVITLPSHSGAMVGKLSAAQVQTLMEDALYNPRDEHVVKPGMVYISQPSEFGTLYSVEELEALSAVCKENGLLLYCDGARLASAIGHFGNVHFAELALCCDAFTIGGTKCGALFGEALVVTNSSLQRGLKHVIKQSGALMAKGYLIACQFTALLEDGLYLEIGKRINGFALQIKHAFAQKGYSFLSDSVSNQQFVILPDVCAEALQAHFAAALWKQNANATRSLRFVCDFAHTQEDVNALVQAISTLPPAV